MRTIFTVSDGGRNGRFPHPVSVEVDRTFFRPQVFESVGISLVEVF